MADTNPMPDALTKLVTGNPPKTVDDMRKLLNAFAPLLNAGLPEVGALHEAVPISAGVTADVVVPMGDGPHPVLVYLHGGGWVCGSPRTHRKLAFRFAEAGYLVVNVDYRLAPEHPFPTPFEDCLAAVRWARKEAGQFGGDSARIAIGGDSAGGNLASAVSAALAGAPEQPRAALLIYGVFDFRALKGVDVSDSNTDPTLAILGREIVNLMMHAYLGEEPGELLDDPRVSPIHAVKSMPPSHLMVGTADPLVDQASALARELAASGVTHEHFVDEGMPHGYAQMEFMAPARPAIDRMIAFLRTHV